MVISSTSSSPSNGKLGKDDGKERGEEKVGEEDLLEMPSGYRFVPNHTQLIQPFLMNKILGRPLSCNIIKHMDLLQEQDPDDLPINEFIYCRKNEGYFFTYTKAKHTEESRTTLRTKSGYWEASGEYVPVLNLDGQLFGYMKSFVFYRGKESEGEKTNWKMKEYRISPDLIPSDELNDNVRAMVEQYVVCKIRYNEPEPPAVPIGDDDEEDDDD